MAHIKLMVEDEVRDILSFSTDYFYPDPKDKVYLTPEWVEIYKRWGEIPKDYVRPTSPMLKDYDRHSPNAFIPVHYQPFGGLLRMVMESTGNDYFFYNWLKIHGITHGRLEFFNAMIDEDMPFRRLEFWDAWICSLEETMSSSWGVPMLLHLEISPATVRVNKSVVIQKNWFKTDITKLEEKRKVYESPVEELYVRGVKGDSEASPGQEVKYEVTRYSKNSGTVNKADRDKVVWAVMIDGKTTRLKIDGREMRGEKISFKVPEEWTGKEVTLMPYLHSSTEDVAVTISVRKMNNCACGGIHSLKITGLGNIKSYSGDFPSPFQIMNYTPSSKEEPLLHQVFVPDKTIRKWIKEAAEYHEIPHEMIAVIIQQENAPSASKWKQFLQFGERTLTTSAAQLDDLLWDMVPDKIADGSSGFMNIRRPTLKEAITYTKEKYGRELMPSNVANKIGFIYNSNIDDGIQGADWRADLYYGAAHIRQLIDRVMGNVCSKGEMTLEQVETVFKSYNGSGTVADKYGKDAIKLLKEAAEGEQILYFYEK